MSMKKNGVEIVDRTFSYQPFQGPFAGIFCQDGGNYRSAGKELSSSFYGTIANLM
jgi:hypothetical protein